MIFAARVRSGIGYAIADLVTDQAGVLGFAQAIGAVIERAGYRVVYKTAFPGIIPPSAGVFVYDAAGRLLASRSFSGAGLPRDSALGIAGDILSNIEAGVLATVPFGMTPAERAEIMTIEPTEQNRQVNGNTYRAAATNGTANGGEAGNIDATSSSQTTAEKVTQQVAEDATAGLTFAGVTLDTTTLLVGAAVVGGLLLMGRGK